MLAFLLLLLCHLLDAQKARLSGRVMDVRGDGLPGASLQAGGQFTTADPLGNFAFELDPGAYWLVVRSVGHRSDSMRIAMGPNEERALNFRLKRNDELLQGVDVVDERARDDTRTQLDAKSLEFQTGPQQGVEGLIKTLPGVVSNTELSSQYSVRGGNFDENMVYVNGIEVYRPFLARSGQQEGLSFINPYMVDHIEFSAGGFEASYGDRMSSVLDIQYRRPDSFRLQSEASLMGGAITVDGVSSNKRLSTVTGARYRTNQLLLGSLDTDADFRPEYFDLQTYWRFKIDEQWTLNALGSYASNLYEVLPSTRSTDFGSFQEALRLTVFFDGKERYTYRTVFGALNAEQKVSDQLLLQYTFSAYQSVEQEYFDVIGAYRLGELELNLGSDDFGEVVQERGVGEFQNFARNELDAIFFNLEHKGMYFFDRSTLSWGLKFQRDDIIDRYKEWERIDSAGYNVPHNPSVSPPGGDPVEAWPSIELFEHFDSRASVQSGRVMAFVQDSRSWRLDSLGSRLALAAGIRTHYWSFNKQMTWSPRATLSYNPISEYDAVWRLSVGWYHQPPIYREMRDLQGGVNADIRAQESIHFVLGNDLKLKLWDRPFRLVTEAYYKQLSDLIPYELDNVRIRYSAQNSANGFAAGLDARINGEFVPGIDSWASMSIMTVQEDIRGDQAGYIPRPTDRRVNFGLYFQDYLPSDPSFRMSLSLFYGTGFPFGPPQSARAEQTFRIPAYRRVDIGFLKVFKERGKKAKWSVLNQFETVWVGLEVFNLLEIRNTVSYLWVRDISTARQYAVPNYLTNRLLNLKLAFIL